VDFYNFIFSCGLDLTYTVARKYHGYSVDDAVQSMVPKPVSPKSSTWVSPCLASYSPSKTPRRLFLAHSQSVLARKATKKKGTMAYFDVKKHVSSAVRNTYLLDSQQVFGWIRSQADHPCCCRSRHSGIVGWETTHFVLLHSDILFYRYHWHFFALLLQLIPKLNGL
jgi:hypothetical protein